MRSGSRVAPEFVFLDDVLQDRQTELDTNSNTIENSIKILEPDNEYRNEIINLKAEIEQVKGFTNLLRQSFVTSLYSFMESWLLRDCFVDSNHCDYGQPYANIKEKGVEKVKKYFFEVKGSNYPFGKSQDWNWIKNFQRLRDCIVHRRGNLTGLNSFSIDKTLEKFIKKEEGLNLSGINNYQIFIEIDFCYKAILIIHRFMIEILNLEMLSDEK